MSRLRMSCLLSVVLFLMASGTALAGSFVFTDSTFDLANYSFAGPYTNDAAASITPSQCSSCGNPGQALQIIAWLPNAGDKVAEGFVNNTFTYDPSTQGAITSIDASVDKDLSADQNFNSTNTFRPLIEQNGIFYMAAISGPPQSGLTTGFNTISQTGLTTSDFLQFDFAAGTFGTGTPNFDGGPMLLGLGQISDLNSGSNIQSTIVYDDLSLTVDTAAPEPPSVLLLGSGMLGLLGVLARRLSG